MLSKVLTLLLLVSLNSCGGQARADGVTAPPAPTIEARQARPVEWARRDPDAPLWPTGTQRLQIVITPGWSAGDRFAWFIADGTKVHRVFHTTTAQLGQLVAHVFGDLTANEAQSPTASLSYGGAGTITKPPTPDPPPAPILPPGYVDQVMGTAWKMNSHVHIDRTIALPSGP